MAKKNYDLLFKLLLIGDSGVGKVSNLTIRTADSLNSLFDVWYFFRSIRHVFYFVFLMIHLMLRLFPQLVLILKSKQLNLMGER